MSMKTMRRALLLAAMILSATACSSERTHFYTLLKPDTAPPSLAGAAAFAIDVQAVRVPAQVDQPQLIVRQGKGELALVETRQWIAPLKDEMRGALSAELGERLHVHDIAGLATSGSLPVYRVIVDVQRLDGWLAHSVSLDAVWTVLGPATGAGSAPSWTCASQVREPVPAGYEPLVIGVQQALAQVAADIAGLIEAAQRGAPSAAACPAAQ